MWEDEHFKILGWWCPHLCSLHHLSFLRTLSQTLPLRTTHLSPSLYQSIALLHYCHACIRHIRSGLIGPSSPGPLANQTPTPHTLRPAEGLKGRDPVLKSKPLIASHAARELPQLSLRIPSRSLILLSSIILHRHHYPSLRLEISTQDETFFLHPHPSLSHLHTSQHRALCLVICSHTTLLLVDPF